jgi:pilus assembly protein CpaE
MTETEKNIRILIVDDNKITVENVTRLLSFESDLEVIASASNGREGVELAAELKPDIILMDINMPDMDGIEACQHITRISPTSRVMMMSVQADMAYFKKAMNAGAREFLTKPFDLDDLIQTVRKVHEADPTSVELSAMMKTTSDDVSSSNPQQHELRRGVLVAVFSPKGGVGCSTIAASMAVALRNHRQADVLLVDGDILFGDLGAMLDLQPAHHVVDILKSDPDDMDLVKQMVTNHESGIHLLAAPDTPALAELVPVDGYISLLESLREVHDYIIVDLGTKQPDMVRRILDMADRVIMVINPDVMSIKNIHLFLSIGDYRDYSFIKLIPVLNRFDPSWGITPEAIGRAIGRPVTMVIPEDEQASLLAVNRGKPVLLNSPRSPMVREIKSLVREMPDRRQLAQELADGSLLKETKKSRPSLASPTNYDDQEDESDKELDFAGRILNKLIELVERIKMSHWIQSLGGHA